MEADDLSWRAKLRALSLVATYRPALTLLIVSFGLLVTLLEGVGISFIIPIVEVVQAPGEASAERGGVVAAFVTAYGVLGVPFTLGYIIVGVGAVLTVRYLSSIVVDWLRASLRTTYVRDLQTRAFRNALDARIEYFDREGSDDILNAIVTQAEYAGRVIRDLVMFFKVALLVAMYLAIALYIAPFLTVLAGLFIGLFTVVIRYGLEAGYAVGDRVADANERIQESVQAGTQGIREVKLLGIDEDLFSEFRRHVGQFTESTIKLRRNEAVINNLYSLSIALTVFVLLYVALTFTAMTLAALATFMFVMFQLGPAVSRANRLFYKVEGRLPHLIRTQQFIEDLERHRDVEGGGRPVPDDPTPITFDEVSFAYEEGEPVLGDLSIEVDRGEFVAIVGQSGEGKSTIAALLARLYDPDEGEITAAGVTIEQFDVDRWRSRLAYVRQDPYIFDASLWENVTIGNPEASRAAVDRACEIAQVTEFLDDLAAGYATELGDNGVRLSGGQRQRVALARALLEDADVIVLDEATSDLDAGIERRVLAGIESMDRDYTVVAIAHRLSTVRGADRIYALEDGAIVERGDHQKLIDEDGTYAALYSAQ